MIVQRIQAAYQSCKVFVSRHPTKILGAVAVGLSAAHDNFLEIADWFSDHPRAGSTLRYAFGIAAMVLGFINSSRRDEDR